MYDKERERYTMKFKMNEREWEIKEIDQKEFESTEAEEGNVFGECNYVKQKIYLWKDLHEEAKRRVLIHELIHCYIGCYVSYEDMVWNEDNFANICANSHDIIENIVNEYFNTKKVLKKLEKEGLK